jgi:hypothetical protein
MAAKISFEHQSKTYAFLKNPISEKQFREIKMLFKILIAGIL